MIFSGDNRGLKETTVVFGNPKRHPILVLSSGDMLLPDANAKILRVIIRKKLEDHSFGLLRRAT